MAKKIIAKPIQPKPKNVNVIGTRPNDRGGKK
jgi:hypothetical protein